MCVCLCGMSERLAFFSFNDTFQVFSSFRKIFGFCGTQPDFSRAKEKNRKRPRRHFSRDTHKPILLLQCYREYRDERYLPLSRPRACARLDARVLEVLAVVIVRVVFSLAVWRKSLKKMKRWKDDDDDGEG